MFKQVVCSGFLLLTLTSLAHAMPPFIGNDYSGKYLCKGNNLNVGNYEVFVTLKLNTTTSHDLYGIYKFSAEFNNQAAYTGHILAKGNKFSIAFKLLNASDTDSSTGVGDFRKLDKNRWSFKNTYYEPDGNGGNFGNDQCIIQHPDNAPKKTSTNHNNNNLS